MASDDLERFIRQLSAYRDAVQTYRWPAYNGPVEDFYAQKQDRQPGLTGLSGKKGLRFIEEMSVYAEDGTLLGFMTLSTSLVQARWGVPEWLTPAFIHTSVTREDLLKLKPQTD